MSSRSRPTARDVAIATGVVRIAAGTMLWVAPVQAIRFSGGRDRDGLLRGVFRYFAGRDLALGVATLAAGRPGGDVPRVVTLQGAADTVDGVLIGALVTKGRLSRSRGGGALALAAGTAAAEFAVAAWLRKR